MNQILIRMAFFLSSKTTCRTLNTYRVKHRGPPPPPQPLIRSKKTSLKQKSRNTAERIQKSLTKVQELFQNKMSIFLLYSLEILLKCNHSHVVGKKTFERLKGPHFSPWKILSCTANQRGMKKKCTHTHTRGGKTLHTEHDNGYNNIVEKME